jgi:ribonuclease VapC
MFVDASALVAILARETDWQDLVMRIDAADRVVVSPVVVDESVLAVARLRAVPVDAATMAVVDFVGIVRAETMPIDAAIGRLALDAFARFAKGRHAAALNMGDCFAYACARSRDLTLLAKGGDFARTDITLA